MQIIHAKRPHSEIVERKMKLTPPRPPKKIRADIMDADFLNGPVDLRKINPSMLPPQTPVGDESDLSIPLSALIGKRIQTAQTPDSVDRKDIDELREMLEQMKEKRRKKREFHLSERLQPPAKYNFCPEQAYTETKIQDIVRERDAAKEGEGYSKSRNFPFELFTHSMGGPTMKIVKPKTRQSMPAETFAEPQFEIHDLLRSDPKRPNDWMSETDG